MRAIGLVKRKKSLRVFVILLGLIAASISSNSSANAEWTTPPQMNILTATVPDFSDVYATCQLDSLEQGWMHSVMYLASRVTTPDVGEIVIPVSAEAIASINQLIPVGRTNLIFDSLQPNTSYKIYTANKTY